MHQKLKFVKNGKLVTVIGEEAFLVNHLSSFSFISADDVEGTSFQGLSVETEDKKKGNTIMSSFKDAQRVVQEGASTGWGKLPNLHENKRKEGLGFSSSEGSAKSSAVLGPIEFRKAGQTSPVNAITEEDSDGESPSFVTPGLVCRNWTAVDVPYAIPSFK